MKIKKIIPTLSFIVLIAIIGTLYSFTTKTITENSTQNQPRWENLKVLPQDISKDSLIHLMKGYTKSLGVSCSHCHSPRKDNPKKLDFPDDSKMPKLIARGMIKMTNDINENYFKPHYPDPKPEQVTDVNCITCHRGNPNPKKYLEGVGSLFPSTKKEKK